MKPLKFSKIKVAVLSSLFGLGAISMANANMPQNKADTENNFYITYVSQNDEKELIRYGKTQGINQFFMWTVDQDTAITDPLSLIKALRENYPEINFAAYYPN
jgi:hypothetical protein